MINSGQLGDFAGKVRKKRPKKKPTMTSIPDPRKKKPVLPKLPTPTAEALKPNGGTSTMQAAKNVADQFKQLNIQNKFKSNLVKAKFKKNLP